MQANFYENEGVDGMLVTDLLLEKNLTLTNLIDDYELHYSAANIDCADEIFYGININMFKRAPLLKNSL